MHELFNGRFRFFKANVTTHQPISPKLWGGMLVAIPTAIPLWPFINSCGNTVGRTKGCTAIIVVRPKSTVSLYISH